MRRPRAAAASDDGHTKLMHKLAQDASKRLGLHRVDRLAVDLEWQARVGNARDRQARVLAQVADGIAHMLGAGRAVEPDHIHRHRLERGDHGGNIGAQQHPAGNVEKNLRLNRDVRPVELLLGAANTVQRGLDLQNVDARLDQQHVHAALDQPGRLFAKGVRQLVEGDVGEGRVVGRGKLARWPHRARHEATAPIARFVLIGDGASNARGSLVELLRLVAETPLFEAHACGLKGVRFEHVAARFHERAVDLADDVGTGVHEVVAVPVGALAAEIVGRERVQIEAGAHRAVIDQHAPRKLGKISRMFRTIHLKRTSWYNNKPLRHAGGAQDASSSARPCLPELAPAAQASRSVPGCRGFTGPVPPPLWMRLFN